MDRTLADSQELFIAISNSYSFPGTHYVTSKERADGEIVISPIINTPSTPRPHLSTAFSFFLKKNGHLRGAVLIVQMHLHALTNGSGGIITGTSPRL